jgi:uncharacterized protein YigA (DUF484 family)
MGVPQPASQYRRHMILRLTSIRRVAIPILAGAVVLRHLIAPVASPAQPYLPVGAWLLAAGEIIRFVCTRWPGAPATLFAGLLAVLDTAGMLILAHLEGGFESWVIGCFVPLGVLYGALLPQQLGGLWVAATALALTALGLGEQAGWLPHYGNGFFHPAAYADLAFVAIGVAAVTIANLFALWVMQTVHQQEREEIATLERERDALVSSNEVEAGRVRSLLVSNDRKAARLQALLEVAQHVTGTHSLDDLLQAVCDTTVALVGVPRVEIYLWNEDRAVLGLAAARGLAEETVAAARMYTAADSPLVGRLRAGEVVEFDAAAARPFMPNYVASALARGMAVPLVCRDAFLGALLVANGGENAQELKEFVQGIARQAAVALVNVRALEQQQEDAEVAQMLLEVAGAGAPRTADARRPVGHGRALGRARQRVRGGELRRDLRGDRRGAAGAAVPRRGYTPGAGADADPAARRRRGRAGRAVAARGE